MRSTRNTIHEADKFLSRNRRHHAWMKIVSVLSCAVVFCTTYALILPAITLEKTYCGKEEHTHGEDCYTQVTSLPQRELACAVELHQHTESCYDGESGFVVCGYADFVVHEHTKSCYNADGDLVCPLPEIEAHTHDAGCYTAPETHVHTEDCYALERGGLICTESTEPVHVHSEECYTGQTVLACTLPEGEGHSHGEDCYNEDGELVCGLEEREEHWDTEECYETSQELTCGQTEEPAHIHTEDCYQWDPVLICTQSTDPAEPVLSCGKEEIILHEHTRKDCFEIDEDGNTYLTCQQVQILEHVHTGDCFQTVEVPVDTSALTCGLEECEEHTHSEDCYNEAGELICQLEESEGHTHGPLCYGVWELTCQQEEHTHTPGCKIPPETEPLELLSPEELANCSAVANLMELDPFAIMTLEEGGSINFADDITKVELEYKDGEVWKPVSGTVKPHDLLRFTLSYTLKGHTLSQDNRTISYQLPSAFHMTQAESGKVYNDAGKEVGAYTISESGQVEITFNDDYVKNNMDGQDVNGFIRVEASVDNIQSQGEKIHIDFSNKVQVDVGIHDPQQDKNDLNVTKTASDPDEDGNIAYTVVIKSQNGTSGPVDLEDVMQNLEGFNGSVSVSGNGITDSSPTVTQNGNTFGLQLPAMDPGAEYTLTYSAKLPANAVASGTAKNTVTVTSKNQDGGELKDSDYVDTQYQQTYISKSAAGQLDGNGMVQWTVTVNQGGHDISGWTLSDTFNDKPYAGPVTIKDSSGHTIAANAALPYQFPANSQDTYTVTYTTPADKPMGESKPKNKADLKSPDGPTASTGDQYGPAPDDTKFEPLKKEAVDFDLSQNPAIPEWRVTIDANGGSIPANWWYKDSLNNGQYFTAEQLEELKTNIQNALSGSGLAYTFAANESGGKTTGFQLNFTTTMEKGSSFTFTYHSTAPLGDMTQAMTFKNSGNILDKSTSSGSVTYRPLVQKSDENGGGSETTHGYYDAQMDGEGVLKWRVEVSPPEGYSGGDLTITENLPEGVTLRKLTLKAVGVTNAGDCTLSPDGVTDYSMWNGSSWDHYSIAATQSGQTITITIPGELAEHRELSQFVFSIHARINDDFSWPKDESGSPAYAPFHNEVTVANESGLEGSAEQTQNVIRDDTKPVVSKAHDEYQDNIIPYRITVNPDGEDLVEGSDTLTLTDTLVIKFGQTIDATFNLVPGSVQVYKLNADGARGDPLAQDQFPYTLRTSVEGNDWNLESHYVMDMTLPDGQALLVEYKYHVNAAIGTSWTVANTAKLEGLGETPEQTTDTITIKVTDSSAGAQTEGLIFTKVDSGNYGVTLKGVKFKLYRYVVDEQGTGGYQQVESGTDDGCFTTDSDGMISIKDLVPNTAYYMEEQNPPQGYLPPEGPYYFRITSPNIETYPLIQPDDFDGEDFSGGETAYIPNEPDTTRIQVDKRWLNKQGEDITGARGGSVSFNLYRMESTEKPLGGGSAGGTVRFRWRARNYGNDIIDITEPDLPVGTIVHVRLATNRYNGTNPPTEVTVNGKKVNMALEGDLDTDIMLYYTYSFTLSQDTELMIVSGSGGQYQNKGDYSVTYSQPESTAPNPEEDTFVESFTISKDGHWTWTSGDLPKTGTNAAGETVYYRYYVEELPVLGAETAYENNTGIVSGAITVRNTVKDDHKMPSTGGAGTAPFTIGGSLLLLLSLPLLYIQAKRRKGDSVSS